MFPTSQFDSAHSKFDPMPARPKSANDASELVKSDSFPTPKRSSTAPLQTAVASNTTPAHFKDAELLGMSLYDIPIYCCRVCEVEALPSTQNYNGPDELHPLRFVGKEANDEWFEVHCAPGSVEPQAVRQWMLQQPVGLQRQVKEEREDENEDEMESIGAVAPTQETAHHWLGISEPSPNAQSPQPVTARWRVSRNERSQQQVTPYAEIQEPMDPGWRVIQVKRPQRQGTPWADVQQPWRFNA